MDFEDQLMIIINLYPAPVIIDRLPGEGPDELPIPHHRARRPGLPHHSLPVAAIFPLMVEPAPGTKLTDLALAKILEARLADPLLPIRRFPKLHLRPDMVDEKENSDDL